MTADIFFMKIFSSSSLVKLYQNSDYSILEKPSPPENLEIMTMDKDSITIRWKKPKSDGGAIVTGYIVEVKDGKFGDFIKMKDVSGAVHTYSAKHLRTDNEYTFRVKAKNSVGVGEPAEIKAVIQPKKVIGK